MGLALQLFQVMRLGAIVLTSILLAKSGLTTAEIGTYEMLVYVGTVMTLFWVIGLLQGIAPVYARLGDADRKALLFNQFLVFCGISLSVCGLLFFGQKFVLPLLTGLRELPHYGLFCLFLLFNLPTFSVEYLYLLQEKPRHIVAWGAVAFGLQVTAVWVPLRMGYGLQGGLTALATLGLLKFGWTLLLTLRYGTPKFRPDIMRQYLQFSGPLILSVLVGNVIVLFDNWLVSWYYADEAVFAIFRYGSREFPLATALATALGTAMIPKLTADLGAGMAELKLRSRRMMHLLFPLTAVLLFAAGPLFPLVFNPDFAASAGLFSIYLLITASRVLVPGTLILAKGQPSVILRIGLLELAVKVLLGFLFIRWWGLVGVAWSAVLAYWLEKLMQVWYLEKKQNQRTSEWLDLRWYVGYVLLLLGAFVAASV